MLVYLKDLYKIEISNRIVTGLTALNNTHRVAVTIIDLPGSLSRSPNSTAISESGVTVTSRVTVP